MAIWQFGFSIIPEEAILKRKSINQFDKKFSDHEDSISWKGYCLSQFSVDKISGILKQAKSWSDNIKQFGDTDETCIELFYAQNTLLEISIRLDLRSLTLNILAAVIDFIKDNKALILTEEGILLRPVVEDVVKKIKKSDAYCFVKNPEEFISSFFNNQQ